MRKFLSLLTLTACLTAPVALAQQTTPPAAQAISDAVTREAWKVIRILPGFWTVPVPAEITGVTLLGGPQGGWTLASGQDGKVALVTLPSGEKAVSINVPRSGYSFAVQVTLTGGEGRVLGFTVDKYGFPSPPCKCLPQRP